MSELENKGKALGLNERQMLFCQYYVQENNQTKAYEKAYGTPGKQLTKSSCTTGGSKLLTKPNINAYVDELRGKIRERIQNVTDDKAITMEEAVAMLTSTAQINQMENPKIMIEAIKEIAKLKDWYSATKIEQTITQKDTRLILDIGDTYEEEIDEDEDDHDYQ